MAASTRFSEDDLAANGVAELRRATGARSRLREVQLRQREDGARDNNEQNER
jgi:hypothetical protein